MYYDNLIMLLENFKNMIHKQTTNSSNLNIFISVHQMVLHDSFYI